jgi:hypothetical protein
MDASDAIVASYSKSWTKSWVDYPKVGIDENNAILRNGTPIYPVDKWLGDRVSYGWESKAMATGYVGKGYSNAGYSNGYNAALWQSEMSSNKSSFGDGWTVSGPDFRGGAKGDSTQLYFDAGGSNYYDPFPDIEARIKAVTDVAKNQSNFLYYDWWDEPDVFGINGTEMQLASTYTNAQDDTHPVAVNISANWFWADTPVPAATRYTRDLLESGGYPVADIVTFDWYPASGYPRSANPGGTLQGAFDHYAIACRNLKRFTKGLIPLGIYVETGKVYNEGIPTTPEQIKMTALMGIVEMDARTIRWYEYDVRDYDGLNGGGPWLWRNTAASADARASCAWVVAMTDRYKAVLAQPAESVGVAGGSSDAAHGNDPRVKAVMKRYQGKTYIFAYNRDVTNSASVTFSLPSAAPVVYVYGGSSLVPVGSQFSDVLPAAGVRVYEIPPNDGTPPDTTPPIVSMTSPSENATVCGSVVLAANASDAHSGVARVDFLVNGRLVGSDMSAPYTVQWDTAAESGGFRTVKARAVDAAGNVAESGVVVDVLVSKITLGASSGYPSYGAKVNIGGSLKDDRGVPVAPGTPVVIEYSYDTLSWNTLAVARTWVSNPGYFSYYHTPSRRTYYRARFSGDAQYPPASASPYVTVWPKVYLGRPSVFKSTLAYGHAYTFSGALKPAHSSSKAVRVWAYRKVNGRYVYKRTYWAKAGSSTYSVKIKLPYRGKWRLRTYHASDSWNYKTYSSYRYVTVK